MPVTTVVVALVLAAVIATSAHRGRPSPSWPAFGAWAVAGFLSGLATVSFAIGLFVLPFAVAAIVIAARLGLWPAALGFVAGAGLVGVLVWVLAAGDEGSTAWLAAGGALALASAAAFRVWRRAA